MRMINNMKSKQYGSFCLTVDDYKENGKFQFSLETPIPIINPHKDFNTPEDAFAYADEVIKNECVKIINELK